ncbi:MAG: hypothetical protein AAGD28_01910 [Bacteroidota bacterium]
MARNLLQNLKPQLEKDSDEYRLCVDKIAHTYNLQWKEALNSPSSQKRMSFLNGFLQHIEEEEAHLPKSLTVDRAHYIYEALIGEYLSSGDQETAMKYKEKLYYAFQNGLLPSSIKDVFSLGKYANGSVSIWGYEWYEGFASPKDKGSFSKMVFSVYPANSAGEEEKELMQFHLKRVNWIDNNLGEYVLVQKPGSSQSGQTVTLWDFSFDRPIDYLELREIIMTLAMSGDSRG